MGGATEPAVSREGKLLVLEHGVTLPARCVICNKPHSGEPVKMKFIRFGKGGVVDRMVQDALRSGYTGPVTAYVHLCDFHRARKMWVLLICAAVILTGVVGGICTSPKNPNLVSGMFVFFLVSAFLGSWFFMMVLIYNIYLSPTRFEDRVVYLKGAGKAFLDGLGQPKS